MEIGHCLQYLLENDMKNPIKDHLLISCLFLSISFSSKSQELLPGVSPAEPFAKQADSLRKSFSQDGYEIVKEAKMNMQSEYEIPVIVPLKEGNEYEFAFIGDVSSKVYEVRMYDQTEKEVVYLKQLGGKESNIISYSFTPKFSAYHIIKPVQQNKKKKNISGYIMMFKKVS
jgi:hypothetical protein